MANPERVVLAIVTGFDPYQTGLIRGARDALASAGHALVAYVTDECATGVADSLACLLAHPPPAGVLIMYPLHREQDEALAAILTERGIPVVRIGQNHPDAVCVRTDNVRAMTLVMEHLLDRCGVRRPVLIRGLAHHPDHQEREAVFRRALADRRLPIDDELFIAGHANPDISAPALGQLLHERRDFDAVVTMDDLSGAAAVGLLTRQGIAVPDEVAVTGFDNYPVSSLIWPNLTTVDQNLAEQGATAARVLLGRVDGRLPPRTVVVPPRLIVRGSTTRDPALLTDGVPTGAEVAEVARELLTAQTGSLNLSRNMIRCRSLEDVRDGLAASLPDFAVDRCFLVAYDGEALPTGPDGIPHRACRLVLDYRDGAQHPVPDEPFSSCRLLPSALRPELLRSHLVFQPLESSRSSLGYLLVDLPLDPAATMEALRMDVARSVEAAFSARDLAAHAAMLENLVTVRTRELESEVAVRRRAEQELKQANLDLQRSLEMDGLTRIANRTALAHHFDEQWQVHVDGGLELAVLMADVDMFKAYNDRYGHLTGDQALRVVASCLERAVRYPDDLACRFGGEEFLVVLPRTGMRAAVTVARRFHRLLAQAAIPHDASPVAPVITASIGIAAQVPTAGVTPEMMIAQADAALYRAKRQGRDQIVVAEPDEIESERRAHARWA